MHKNYISNFHGLDFHESCFIRFVIARKKTLNKKAMLKERQREQVIILQLLCEHLSTPEQQLFRTRAFVKH